MTAQNRVSALLLAALSLCLSCRENDLARVPEEVPEIEPAQELPSAPASAPEMPPPAPPRPASCQTGAVMGRLCLPGTASSLAGARVVVRVIDCLGMEKVLETTASEGGRFSLVDVPEGHHSVVVEDPRWQGTLADVDVRGGQISTLDNQSNGQPLCTGQMQPRIAVVTGEYDDVTELLEQLGLKYDRYDGERNFSPYPTGESLISDPAKLAKYDAIFFACGSLRFLDLAKKSDGYTYNPDHAVFKNLRTFLAHGGNLYTSDWAWPVAKMLAPQELDFVGNDANTDEALVGASGSVRGDIRFAALSSFMGANSLAIEFDLPGWAVLESVGPKTEIFLSGDVELETPKRTLKNAPLIVSSRPNGSTGGRVLFTTFHHHAQSGEAMRDTLRFLIFQL